MMLETVIWIICILAILAAGAAFIVAKLLFKHTVIIRDAGQNDIVIHDKAREKVIDGVKYWQLMKERDKELKIIPVPPREAIDITKKGKKIIEVFRTSEGNYEFIKISSKNLNVAEPLTSKQRMILMNNFRKSQERKGFNIREHIPTMMALGSFVLILAILVFGWSEIMKPVVDVSHDRTTQLQYQKETMEILKEIKLGIQTIKGEEESDQKVPD